MRAMEPVARYGYLELLLTQWQSEDCSISADPLDLADASGLGDVLWEKLSARIVRNFEILPSGRLRNAVCFEEWQEAKNIFEENRQARSEAGKRGANARWGHADAIAKPSPPMAIAKENHGKKCLTGTVTETETKEQKPSRRKTASEPKEHSDSRYAPCKDLVFAAYKHKNNIDPPWEGREGQALAMLLRSWPQLRVEDFRRALGHWARSEVAHSDRPGIWIPKLSSFLGAPIDRFNKPFASSERPAKEGYGMDPRNGIKSTRAEYEEWLAMPEDYRQKHRWVFEIPEAK